MKFVHFILIIILSIVIQASFIRLFGYISFAPNIPILILFLSCYYLTYEKILLLAIFTGVAIDFISSISFGSTMLAAIFACSLSFYLKENLFKGGRFNDFLLNIAAAIIVFYILLNIINGFLNTSQNYSFVFNLLDINTLFEILLNIIFGIIGYYLIGRYSNNKIYGFVQNIKISSEKKISK